MTAKHQRILLNTGISVIALGLAMAVVRAMWLLEFDGKLDFWPFVSGVGLMLVLTAGVAGMKESSEAPLVAFMLRLFNTGFVFFTVVAAFMWLPVNNRVGADWLIALVANGALFVLAVAYWWFVHRELRLALKKEIA